MMLRDHRQPRISPDFVARIATSHFLNRQIIVTGISSPFDRAGDRRDTGAPI